MTVSSQQRWRRDWPCPVCGGHQYLPRHQGARCEGNLSSCGRFARCARPEHAGPIQVGPDGLYPHYLRGTCRCGSPHEGPVIPIFRPKSPAQTVTKSGTPIPNGSAALVPHLAMELERRGLRRELYGMYGARPDLMVFRYQDTLVKARSIDKSRMFWSPAGAGARPLYGLRRVAELSCQHVAIVEGELDLHSLREVGIENVVSVPDGSHTRLTPALLAPLERFAGVVLAVDADTEGEGLAQRLAEALGPARCRRVRFAGFKDANDALRAGWRREDFMRALASAAKVAA